MTVWCACPNSIWCSFPNVNIDNWHRLYCFWNNGETYSWHTQTQRPCMHLAHGITLLMSLQNLIIKDCGFQQSGVVGRGFTWPTAHGGHAASCLSLTAGLSGSTVPWFSRSAPPGWEVDTMPSVTDWPHFLCSKCYLAQTRLSTVIFNVLCSLFTVLYSCSMWHSVVNTFDLWSFIKDNFPFKCCSAQFK